MPIGIDPAGRWVFLSVASGGPLDGLHWLLQQHAGLLGALPAWVLRIVFPCAVLTRPARSLETSYYRSAGLILTGMRFSPTPRPDPARREVIC
jgi:hypothetical protein